MTVSVGRQRRVLPPSTLGHNHLAQRRVSEAVGRAAEKTNIAVSVDAHQCRLWLRNPRGTIPCPCSSASMGGEYTPLAPSGAARTAIQPNEGDDINGPDSGYPLYQGIDSGELPEGNEPHTWGVDDVSRMLLGNGRRCGICWGTGWLDGHKLWGGLRVVLCIADTLEATVLDGATADVDMLSPTPTMLGPEMPSDPTHKVQWTVSIPPGFNIVDALRVRDGLNPAGGNWSLQAQTATVTSWTDAATALDLAYGAPGNCGHLTPETMPTQFQLILGAGARVSHIELVLRSEPLVPVQLPQLQMTASAELIAPMMAEEFELSPYVGYVERASLIEIPGVGGRVGMVWYVADVTVKRDAQGTIFGVIGNCRNAQPTDVWAAASLDDSLLLGTLDPGQTSRGFEATGAGEASGVGGITDDSLAAVKRGSKDRLGGGAQAAKRATIIISTGVE